MTPEEKKYLEQGGALTNGNIPTKIAPTGSPTVPINSSLLEPVSQLPYVNPNPVPVPSITGLSTDVTQLTAPEVKATDLTSRLQELNKQLVGESTFRTQQEDTAGIQGLQKTQQDLANQLKAVQAEAQAIPLSIQQEYQGRGATAGGVQSIQTARLRNNAIQALTLGSLLQASQGNIALAKDFIDRAVSARFDPIREKIATETANLKLIVDSPEYSLADKNRANAMLAQKESEIKNTLKLESNAKAIYDFSLRAAEKGADALTLRKIQSAETPEEAMVIAAPFLKEAQKITISGTNVGTSSDLVEAVIANPELYNDLTATVKGKIAGELANRGFTGFGKILSDTAIKEINQTQGAVTELGFLKTLIEENQDKIGPITGLAAINPYSEARKIQADIDRIRQTVGKALEGGVLRKEDEEKYKKILATMTDTPSTAIYKIEALINSLNRDVSNYTELQGASGKNVGGINLKSTTDLRQKYGY